jgi:L-aminoadipate-semialdehyde dehydrogenase
MFAHLLKLKYPVERTEYMHWRSSLMDYTVATADHALYPLLHFVLDDLPTSTKSAELDDTNTREIIKRGKVRCESVEGLMPLYIGYFIKVGFLDAPPDQKLYSSLPYLPEWEEIKGNIVQRSLN